MTTEYDEKCLVCGEKTKNRCSSCVKAGIDLYFCSTEHQKLVRTFFHPLEVSELTLSMRAGL